VVLFTIVYGYCATKILWFYLWAPGVPSEVVLTPRLLYHVCLAAWA